LIFVADAIVPFLGNVSQFTVMLAAA